MLTSSEPLKQVYARSRAPLMRSATQKKRVVLLVDDSEDTRDVMTLLLGQAGYHCLQAGSGAEALELVKRHRPTVAIADLLMPSMDGITLAGKFREISRLAAMPVLLLTGSPTLPAAQRKGLFAVLSKPFEPSQLLAMVSLACDSVARGAA